LPASMHAAVAGLTDCLDALADLVGSSLGGPEADAFAARVLELARRRTHPAPPTDRPPLPWPIW
ncbi:MAG: phosphatidylinositol kinase, partial [Acidimicrobiia bacterium]